MRVKKVLFSLILGVMLLSASFFVITANSQNKINVVDVENEATEIFDEDKPEYKDDENAGRAWTVTFDANVVPGYVMAFLEFNSKQVESGNVIGTLPEMTDKSQNYIFMGWTIGNSISGHKYVKECDYVVDGNITMYAQWMPFYFLNADANGGTIISDGGWFPINGGKTGKLRCEDPGYVNRMGRFLTLPTVNTRSGYRFLGWAGSPSGSMGYLQAPLDFWPGATIYAVWEPYNYTIKYDANGGKGAMTDQSFTFDNNEDLKTNAFEKNGYQFIGWTATDINGTIKDISPSLTAVDVVKALGYQNSDDQTITLKAKWSSDVVRANIYIQDTQGVYQYNITRNVERVQGKSLSTVANELGYVVEGGISYTHTLRKPVNYFEVTDTSSLAGKYNETNRSWNFEFSEKISYDGESEFIYCGIDESMYFLSNGTTRTFNINFRANEIDDYFGIQLSPKLASAISYGEDLSTRLDISSSGLLDGVQYVLSFDCLLTARNLKITNLCVRAESDDAETEISEIDLTMTDITMYFDRMQHTVSIDPNGGTWKGNSGISSLTGYYGGQYTLEDAIRPGYTFGGWRQVSGFATISNKKITFSTTDVAVEAIWTSQTGSESFDEDDIIGNEYTIYYNENGGEPIEDGYYNTREVYQSVKLPTGYSVIRNGYNFVGWEFENPVSGMSIQDGYLQIQANAYGDVYLTAIWEGAEYSIDVINGDPDSNYTTSGEAQARSCKAVAPVGYEFDFCEITGDNTSIYIEHTSGSNYTIIIPANSYGNATVKFNFKKIDYLINVTGGTANISSYTISEDIQSVTLTATPPTGYEIDYWTLSGDNANASISGNVLTIPSNSYGNINIQANNKKVDYTITVEGGSANASTYNIQSNNQTISLTVGENPGHTFKNWEVSGDNTSAVIEGNSLIIIAGTTGNIIVTAQWDPYTYRVYWTGNRGVESDVLLTTADMWNYAGMEGYTDTNAGSKYLYSITSGSYNISSTVSYNTILDYYTPIPVIAGYNFEGWYTGGHGVGQKVADEYGNWIANVEGYTDSYKRWICDETDGIIELFAYYTAADYAIAYDYVGGTSENPATYSVATPATINQPTKKGYTFAGWEATIELNKLNKATLLSNGTQNYNSATPNAVLYSLFYIKNGITYSGSLSEGSISWVKYTKTSISTISTSQSIEGSDIYVANYYPNGNADAVASVSFNIPSGDFETSTYNLMGRLLLKAKWTINTYTLTVKPNGGTWNNTINDSIVRAEYGLSLAIANPKRLGYQFNGWTLSGSGEWIDEARIYIYSDGDGELSANWIAVAPTITISSQPNDSVVQTTIVYGNRVVFTADAEHDLPITYQWYCSTTQGFSPTVDKDIAGATNEVYTLEAKAKGVGTYYYKCVATANGLSTISNEIKLIINKAQNVFDVDINMGLVYNGSTQVLLKATDINEVENDIYYTVKNHETDETLSYSTDLPTAVEAGEYAVYFTVAESDNYLRLEGSAIVIIDKLYSNLTIDPAGGNWNGSNQPQTFRNYYGEQIEISDPVLEGYDFEGWALTGDGIWDDQTKTFTYGMTDTTLTARWEGSKYSVYFDYNYSGIGMNYANYISGVDGEYSYDASTGSFVWTADDITGNEYSYIKLQVFKDDTYLSGFEDGCLDTWNFDGIVHKRTQFVKNVAWNRLRLGFNGNRNDAMFYIDASRLINGKTYYLSFDCDNTNPRRPVIKNVMIKQAPASEYSAPAKQVTYGTAMGLLPEPTRPGYTFGGWVDVNALSTYEISKTAGATENFAFITAKFETYGGLHSEGVTPGEKYLISIDEVELIGYDKIECVIVKDMATWVSTTYIPAGKNVCAVIECPDTYAITDNLSLIFYCGLGGYTANNTLVLRGLRIARIDADNPVYVDAATRMTATYDYNLMAIWIPNDNNEIIYDVNGGTWATGYPAQATIKYTTSESVQTINLPTNLNISRNGYTFGGWEIVENENSVPTGATVTGTNKTTLSIPANDYSNIKLKAIWIGETYEITYQANNGAWADGATTQKGEYTTSEEEQTIELLDGTGLSRNGYTFKGWEIVKNSKSAGSSIIGESKITLLIPANEYENIVLAAIWEGISYKIEINENGGDAVSDLAYITGAKQEIDLTAYIPTRNGYGFDGWTFVKYSTPVADIQGNTMTIPANAYGDMELKAEWKGKTYNIIYDENGGTEVANQAYTTGEAQTINLLTGEDIERNGYSFSGWEITANSLTEGSTITGANKTTLSIPANDYSDINLRAIWTGNSYAIEYDTAGGQFANAYNPVISYTTQGIASYISINLPIDSNISRGGYLFVGWEIEVNSVPSSEIVGNNLKITKNAYGNIKLKAIWEGGVYNISYNVNSGKWKDEYTITPASYETKSQAQEFNLPDSDSVIREGYTFDGWEIVTNTQNIKSSIDNKVELLIPANAYGDISVTAKWNINSYTLYIDLNHDEDNNHLTATENVTTVRQEYNTTYTPTNPTREGYNFTGWTVSLGGKFENGIYTFGIADGVLTAQWEVLQFTLTIKPNGGMWANGNGTPSAAEQQIIQNYGTSIQINNPTREGYEFDGWTLDGEGTLSTSQGCTYTFGANNDTLTANWKGKTYTITIEGGTSSLAAYQTKAEAQTATLTADEKLGYEFVKWNLRNLQGTDNLNAIVSATEVLIPANSYGDIVIEAEYEVKVYTIYYEMRYGNWVEGFEPITTYTIESPTIVLPTAENIYKVGHTFKGWFTTAANTPGTEITEIAAGTTGNILVHAKFSMNTYTLLIDLNYDDDNNIETYPTGNEATVRTHTGSYEQVEEREYGNIRRGFTFLKWEYEGDGIFEDKGNGAYKYTYTGDGKITAIWEMDTYLLELDYQGGTVSYLDSLFKRARDYTYDIYDLPEHYDPTLTAGDGSSGWHLGVYADYKAGYVNLVDGTGFNGSRSLNIRVDEQGEKVYSRRVSYSLFRENNEGLPFGTYQLDMYVKVDKPTSEFKIYCETYYEETYSRVYEAQYYNLTPNVWYHLQGEIKIVDEKTSLTNLMFYFEVGATYQIDEVKLVRLTDEYGNRYDAQADETVTTIPFDYSTSPTKIPNAVKHGYTFIGWNENPNATENTTTGWATDYGGESWDHNKPIVGSKKYYAIYKLSNPTVAINVPIENWVADNRVRYDLATQAHNMEYNKDQVTLTANVNTEGLIVDRTNYQWHVSTTPNFTPSSSTAISGANSQTFIHDKTFKNVGTYYYACVVSVEKDGVISQSIQSDYASVVVSKGTPSATISMSDYIYSETPSIPRCSNNVSGGKLTYYYNTTNSTSGGAEWKDITSTTLNAGTYYMYATIEATSNFKDGVSNVVEFKVYAKEITKPVIAGEYIYNRNEQTANIVGFDPTKMVIAEGSETKATNAGTYTITIALLDKTNYNYSWNDGVLETYGTTQDLELTWTIKPYDLSNVTIADIEAQRYTTFAIEPKPTVTATALDNYVLVENTDFTFSYKDNIEIGTAILTIIGQGNYTGTKSTTFEIRGALVDKPTITETYKYNATEHEVTINGFNENTMTIVEGSVTRATNAGTYTITVALKPYYTWREGLSLDNITLTWKIDKADVTLTPKETVMTIRVGERITNEVGVTTSYGGSIDGQRISGEANPPDGSVDYGVISGNKSIVTILLGSRYQESDKLMIRYLGDDNHNSARTSFDITIIQIHVEFIIHGSGAANVSEELKAKAATDMYDVAFGSSFSFIATPSANNGLIKYSIQNSVTYMEKTSDRKLTDSFTSAKITVNDTLLGNTRNNVANNIITITLWFDKVSTVTLDTDATQTGATSHLITTRYEEHDVNFEYDESSKVLTAFSSAQLNVGVTANKIGDQYYIINKVTVGSQVESRKELNTTITTDVVDLENDSNINVQAVKVFNAEDRSVVDQTVSVGKLEFNANAADAIDIDKQTYVIENSLVDIKITKTNDNYDFLAIKVNGVVTLKGQFVGMWEHNGDVSTWKAQQYTKELSEIEAIILEKWYTSGDSDRIVEVEVVEGIDAKLINTDIGYSYTLADNIFNVAGSESLYVGNWKVHVESANVTNYQVKVTIKTGSSELVYGKDETFKIDSTITKVIIEITAV